MLLLMVVILFGGGGVFLDETMCIILMPVLALVLQQRSDFWVKTSPILRSVVPFGLRHTKSRFSRSQSSGNVRMSVVAGYWQKP